MSSSRKRTAVACVALLTSMTGALVALNALDRVRHASSFEQSLYIRSPKTLRRLCLGYTGFVADIYWTRAVQYFGYQHLRQSDDYPLLAPLLQIATELDPRLLPPYQFGANFLAPQPPNGAGQPIEALTLLKYGVEHNPDQWRLYYNLGFLYFTELKDYAKAADAFAAGAKLANSNPFMPVLAARMAQHAGEFDTARMLWYTTYETTNQPSIKQNAVDHLLALRVDEDVTHLEELVAKYKQQTGRAPEGMADLERVGFIRGIPTDPRGKPYKLMSNGRIEVQDPESLLFITKGLPPGMSTPVPKPRS